MSFCLCKVQCEFLKFLEVELLDTRFDYNFLIVIFMDVAKWSLDVTLFCSSIDRFLFFCLESFPCSDPI